MNTKNVVAIILAAGKGERMKSSLPKVLHQVCGRPMIGYVLDLTRSLKIDKVVAVVGYKREEVGKFIGKGIKLSVQEKMLGTADAVKKAMPALRGFSGTVLVLYGDTVLLKKQTLEKLLKHHIDSGADVTLLTGKLDKPAGYGRVLRDKYASICGIVEDKDADDFQKEIKEVNTGIVCFKKSSLERTLKEVKPNNRKKEYYLTDTIAILNAKKAIIENIEIADINESLGINSCLELSQANCIMQQRINEALMDKGVRIIDPKTAYINYDASIGQDTVIYPFTVIEKNVKIGKQCSIGPFVRLREDTEIKDNATLGNFLEVSRSKVGYGAFIKHFGYIGDSRLGDRANIGAGTVTANFDGKEKQVSVIEDDAFLGCDTVLVAPVKVGKAAKTGAGSVVTKNKDVPAGCTVVGVPARILKK